MSVAMSGVVLAGGASRRMGTDKAQVVLGTEPLVVRAVRILAQVCTDVVVASGDGHRLDHLGLGQVADAIPDAGPLAGIAAGIDSAGNDLVAVLAVDMPRASPGVFGLLARLWQGEAAVVPVVGGRWEPLHGLWARAAAPRLAERLAAGDGSVKGVLATLGVRLVGEDEWRAVEPAGTFAVNLNTPDDVLAEQVGV
jgi:molybdopterin-guanine dinucleotide biosynthesis protein A